MAGVSDPNSWHGQSLEVPPHNYQQVATDGRFWWTAPLGQSMGSDGDITYIGSDPIPNPLIINWQIVEPSEGPHVQLLVGDGNSFSAGYDLGTAIGIGTVTVDTTGFAGIVIGFSRGFGSTYDSVVALSFALPSSNARLTWTPSETDITEIKSYSIFRNDNGGEYALLIECAVLRDMFGGIIGMENCTTTASPNDDSGQVLEKFIEDAPVTYLDTMLTSGHTYCYYVQANPMGNTASGGSGPPSAPSNVMCVTADSSTPQASAPVLSGNIVGTDVDLSWTASTISGSTITNYQIWKSIDSGAFALLTTLGNVLAYADSTTTTGHTYQYYVIAVPAVGLNSNHSNTVTKTPGSSNTFVIQNGLFTCNLTAIGVDPAMQGLVPLTGHTGTDLIAGVGGSLISGDAANKVYAVGTSTDLVTGMVFAVVGSYAQTDLTSLDFVGNDAVSYHLTGAVAGGYAAVTDPGDPTLTYTWWNWYSGGGGPVPPAAFQVGQQVTLTVNSSVITL